MKVNKVIVGDLEENCYIISNDNNECLVVDPGADKEKIISCIGNKKVLAILLTHAHFDHIGALNDIKCDNVIACENALPNYEISTFKFKVIKNPGHTSDSISFYFEDESIMFVGDFVFKGSIGRCDLPTGNYEEMKESISKLCLIDKNIILYPGHGEETNLDYEKKYNPYF